MPSSPPRPSEAFFQRIVEDAEEGVWLIDREQRTIYLNPRMASMLGGTVDALLGRQLWDFMDESEVAQAQANLHKRQAGVRETHEFRLRRLDGSPLWAQLSTAPLLDRAGQYEGAMAFVSDIGWRHEAEQRLAESERTYQEFFERSPNIKLVVDPADGRIVNTNQAARAYYGYTVEEFQQLHISDINTLSAQEVAEEMQRATREERNAFLFRHRLKNGEVRDVEVRTIPIIHAGKPLLHSIVHDISRQKAAEHTLRLTQFSVEQAGLAVLWVDQAGIIRYANAYAGELANCTHAQLLNRPIWEFNLGSSEARWPELWAMVKKAGAKSMRSLARRLPDGSVPVEVRASHLLFEGEEFMVTYSLDISEQVQAEGMLAMQHAALEALAAGHSLQHLLHLITKRVEELAPDTLCSILLLDGEQLKTGAAPSLPAAYSEAIHGVHIGPNVGSCGTAAYFDRSVEVSDIASDPLWADYKDLALQHGLHACWSTPIHASDGRVLGTFALYFREKRSPNAFHRKIVAACSHLAGIAIEHRAAEARVHTLAFYDVLTGLPNRSLFADRVELALARAQREASQVALMFIDLDRFKTINDSLGHATGDRLLKTVAKRLEGLVRESDTVCRLGGDEFVLLLPDCDMNGAALLAEKLIAAAGERVEIDGLVLSPSASMGISLYPSDGEDYDALLKHADTAMYRAKEGGRNTYCFYRHDMNEDAAARLEMEAALRLALVRGELLLYYQPQLDIASGELYGLEALLRWQHPQWGMVSPAKFVPVAEECGLIDVIGAWVLDEACRQMAEWQRMGVAVPRVAVNLSVRQFRHDNLPQRVEATLARHQLRADQLTLEITESLMMLRDDDTLNALRRLDGMGITLAVDDFGTGYSSLGYLKRFPVRELKLDQSFVRDLSDDPDDRALASAVVRIGQSLRLKVVAEGVETAEQLEFLRGEGCDIAQGYHFARPMGADRLAGWVRERR